MIHYTDKYRRRSDQCGDIWRKLKFNFILNVTNGEFIQALQYIIDYMRDYLEEKELPSFDYEDIPDDAERGAAYIK